MTRTQRRSTVAVGLLALPLALAACGSSSTGTSASTPMAAAPTSSSAMPAASPSTMTAADQVFGSACSAVSTTGPGSFDGMATDPVATAASHNPALSTLVAAVSKAGLVDSLNTAQGITVFAPVNDAFTALGTKTVDAAMADPKGLLTQVLTYHVVPGRLSPDQLAGTHKTLEGATLSVMGSGSQFTVNGTAKVVCGNVPTANATVYLIDGVLLPKS